MYDMTEGYVKDRYDGSYDAAMQIAAAGYARRRLRPHERAALECLRSIAGRFFACDPEWKNMFCGGAIADGPGLEADTGAGDGPLWGGPGELVILPGELMSAMTAGQIPSLSHQAAGTTGPAGCRSCTSSIRHSRDESHPMSAGVPISSIWP